MSCCGVTNRSTDRVFSLAAPWYEWRYRLLGLDRHQKELVAGVLAAGTRDASVLEVGSGVGHLHHHLLRKGLGRATGVELSQGMIDLARRLARRHGVAERTRYHHGDFVDLADDLPDADVTVLDRAVCCYPDAAELVGTSLDRTRRVYALTWPRDHRFNRAAVRVLSRVLGRLGIAYRAWVHDVAAIEGWIAGRGFRKAREYRSALWLTQVWVRDPEPSDGRGSSVGARLRANTAPGRSRASALLHPQRHRQEPACT
jgi:magnesium-protoporphyrin O-methyltransferase